MTILFNYEQAIKTKEPRHVKDDNFKIAYTLTSFKLYLGAHQGIERVIVCNVKPTTGYILFGFNHASRPTEAMEQLKHMVTAKGHQSDIAEWCSEYHIEFCGKAS